MVSSWSVHTITLRFIQTNSDPSPSPCQSLSHSADSSKSMSTNGLSLLPFKTFRKHFLLFTLISCACNKHFCLCIIIGRHDLNEINHYLCRTQSCSRVGSTRGSGRVGSGRVQNIDKNGGSGRVGSRPWRIGSGPSTLTRPDPPCFSKPVNVNFDSDTQPTLCILFPIIQRNLHQA